VKPVTKKKVTKNLTYNALCSENDSIFTIFMIKRGLMNQDGYCVKIKHKFINTLKLNKN